MKDGVRQHDGIVAAVKPLSAEDGRLVVILGGRLGRKEQETLDRYKELFKQDPAASIGNDGLETMVSLAQAGTSSSWGCWLE